MNNKEENTSTENSDSNNEAIEQSLIKNQVNPLEQSSQGQDVVKENVSMGKPKKNKSLLIIIVTILVLVGCAVGAYFVLLPKKVVETIDVKQQAIDQAKEYTPDPGTACTMAFVPATHTKTGAKYTFTDGCLAPGWVSDDSIVGSEKEKVMTTWSKFSEPTIGLSFIYPSEWGEAKFEVINSTPDELNPTFYGIRFSSRLSAAIDVHPKESRKEYNQTFYNIRKSLVDLPDSRHVFVDTPNIIAEVAPSFGNQTSIISAARLIDIPKISAEDIILSDHKEFDSSCKIESYEECYSKEELSVFQWVLESAEAQP